MAKKRAFPGSMTAEQRENLAKKIAAEKKEAEKLAKLENQNLNQNEIAHRKALINKFVPKIKGKTIALTMGIVVVVNYAIGFLDYRCADFYNDTSLGASVFRRVGPNIGHAIIEAYDPYFHGSVPDGFGAWRGESKAYRNDFKNIRWIKHVSVLGLEALVLACILYIKNKKRRYIRDDIDLMLEIESLAKNFDVPTVIVRQMMLVSPDIIKHMSKENSVFFEMLINGKMDYHEPNTVVFGAAKAVLEGHLESHPEDIKRVISVFYKDSIPETNLAQNFR